MGATEETVSDRAVASSDDEPQLIKAAARGSAEAARSLVGRHWEGCYRAAYLVVRDHQRAEDVAQESLLKLVAQLPQWREGSPISPWLHRVVVNRSLDLLRAEAIRPQPASSDATDGIAGEQLAAPDPELIAALGHLEPEDRVAIVMRYVLDYRAAEIGEVLGMPEATVRTRLARALQKLRSNLEVSNAD